MKKQVKKIKPRDDRAPFQVKNMTGVTINPKPPFN